MGLEHHHCGKNGRCLPPCYFPVPKQHRGVISPFLQHYVEHLVQWSRKKQGNNFPTSAVLGQEKGGVQEPFLSLWQSSETKWALFFVLFLIAIPCSYRETSWGPDSLKMQMSGLALSRWEMPVLRLQEGSRFQKV